MGASSTPVSNLPPGYTVEPQSGLPPGYTVEQRKDASPHDETPKEQHDAASNFLTTVLRNHLSALTSFAVGSEDVLPAPEGYKSWDEYMQSPEGQKGFDWSQVHPSWKTAAQNVAGQLKQAWKDATPDIGTALGNLVTLIQMGRPVGNSWRIMEPMRVRPTTTAPANRMLPAPKIGLPESSIPEPPMAQPAARTVVRNPTTGKMQRMYLTSTDPKFWDQFPPSGELGPTERESEIESARRQR